MPAPLPADLDCFRNAVTTLPPGPLRDVLIAVAYARDAAARTGTGAAPHDRWQAVVAVAERAIRDADTEVDAEVAPWPVPAAERRSSAAHWTTRAARHRVALHRGLREVGVR